MSSVAMSCRKRKCILKWLIVEEMEDDGIIETLIKPRQVIHPVFSYRTVEGYFKNLIMNHLRKDENKFLEFFRLSMAQFDFLLSLIAEDMKKVSYNRNLYPVSSEEKLALTLR